MYYKWLNEDLTPCNGGRGQWLPARGWMPKLEGELVPCEHGYHLCREQDLIHWIGPVLWRVETRGDCETAGDKVFVREARLLSRVEKWNEKTARLFAVDCAEAVIGNFDGDPAPLTAAIHAAREYAHGRISVSKLSAAWSAAWSAARSAADSAARSAQNTMLCGYLNIQEEG